MKLRYFIFHSIIAISLSCIITPYYLDVHANSTEALDNNGSEENCDHKWSNWYCPDSNEDDSCVKHNVKIQRICEICHAVESKEVASFGSHIYGKWIIKEEATPWKTGKKYRECQRCLMGAEEIIIPKRKMTTNEKKVYTTAKKLFTYAKSYNIKKMNACFTSKQPSTFFTDNKYMASYCRKYNKKKLKVTPVDVVIKGNKATITFKVTYPDAYKPLLKSCEAMNWNGHSYHKKKGQAKMKAYVKKYTKKYGVKKSTKNIKVSLKKTKKKGWKISSSSTVLKNAINCNYRTAFKDAK